MSRNLEDLPGVGPQLAHKIRTRFSDDVQFFAAAARQDLQAISAVPGITERRAVDLVLAAEGHDAPDRFLATPAARRVHDRIMERLLSYACTGTGRNRLRLLHPLPGRAAAQDHIRQVMDAKAMAKDLDHACVTKHLRRLKSTPRSPQRTMADVLVVAESDSVHETLQEMDVDQHAIIGTPRDLQGADAYDLVVVAYDEGHVDATGIENAVEVSIDEGVAAICPQAVLGLFHAAMDILRSCAALAEATGRPSVAPEMLRLLDDTATATTDADDVRAAIDAIKSDLDQELNQRMADHSLAGPELLTAISTGQLPPALQRIMDAVLQDGRQRLYGATGLRLQPFTSGFPLQVDDDEVDRVLAATDASERIERFHQDQAAARRLDVLAADLWDEVRGWQEFDAMFALGRFALDHDLHAPTFADSLAFDASIHLDLATDPDAQHIAYHLGDNAPVAVLTGANSGGKSTLLEHLTQLVVMARMGLPVVGEGVQIPWLDEVHLVTARRGLDAGAFETFLRGFLPVTTGDARRLVLADEVEAVTELDAAGRILAWVLDRLVATDSMAVVVTHLADVVMQHVETAQVRVDGIEATGLDDDHRLVVDRCPVMGRAARSTPELIIRRLAATTRGTEQGLYTDLLHVFESPTEERTVLTSHA